MVTDFSQLSHDEKIAFWREVERLLRFVTNECLAQSPGQLHNVVTEYLDHNELGLAWEAICFAIDEEGYQLSKNASAIFLQAGRMMGFDRPDSDEHGRRDCLQLLSEKSR